MMLSEAVPEGDSRVRKLSRVGLFGGSKAGVVSTSGPLLSEVMTRIQNGVSRMSTARIVKTSRTKVRLR